MILGLGKTSRFDKDRIHGGPLIEAFSLILFVRVLLLSG